MSSSSEIEHFGIKGMHWGVHKKRPEPLPRHPDYNNRQYSYDQHDHGRSGAQNINAKLHQGVSLKQARKEQQSITMKKRRRNTAIILAAYAVWRLHPLITHYAKTALLTAAASKVARDGARAAANLLADSHGLTSAATVNLAFNAAKNVWE